MPWKDRPAMDEKRSFIMEYLAEGISVTELCKAFGISGAPGYRYKPLPKGVLQSCRSPRRIWKKTSASVQALIV